MPEPGWPDPEAVVMELLSSVAATVQTLPPDLTELSTPVIRVLRIGGNDDGITDAPLMSVECFGTGPDGYDEARRMAEDCRQIILASGCTTVTVDGAAVLIDAARTATGPTELPYANPDLRRKPATYQLWFRRRY